MTVYAVFINKPDETTWDALEKEWPNGRHFILDGSFGICCT